MDLEGLREPRKPTPPMLRETHRSKSQDSLGYKHYPSKMMKDPFYSDSQSSKNHPQSQGTSGNHRESLAIRMGQVTLRTDEPLSPPPSPVVSLEAEPTGRAQAPSIRESRSYQRPPRGEPEACIFVASLSSKRSDRELHRDVMDHFGQWGKVLSAKVSRDAMGRPFSFVQFEVRLLSKFSFLFLGG